MFFTFYKCTWWVKITCTCSPSEVSFIKNKWMEQREGELVTAARKLGVQTRTEWPENLSPRGTDGKRFRYILLKALFRFPLTLCLCSGLTLLLISARNWGSAQKTLMNTHGAESLRMSAIILKLTFCTGIWLNRLCVIAFKNLYSWLFFAARRH